MVYICVVIWWAIKSEPTPPDLAEAPVVDDTPPAGGSPRRRRAARAAGRCGRTPRDAVARPPGARKEDSLRQ